MVSNDIFSISLAMRGTPVKYFIQILSFPKLQKVGKKSNGTTSNIAPIYLEFFLC
jgi:hypothetical protein